MSHAQKKKRTVNKTRVEKPSHTIPPAGLRADRRGAYGIPIPDRHSVAEEFQWRQEHQQ